MTSPDRAIEPISGAVHLCVDMQRIFARGGLWETPWMERVLPAIVNLCAWRPERTVFTRFITPETPEQRPGRWQRYYRRWKQAMREHLDAGQLELVPRFVPPALVVDKPAYSAFSAPDFGALLRERHVHTLVVSGAETMSACWPVSLARWIWDFAW